MKPEGTALRWLLEGDPAIAWQTQRDLLGRAPATWQRLRRQVAKTGWGAQLLQYRDADGTWGGGLYSPKWTSTFYSLRLLTHLGISPRHPQCVASARLLLNKGVTAAGGVRLWSGKWTDTCVTAMLLSMACYFGLAEEERCQRMLTWLLQEQMPDGGWNCERESRGAVHSSLHTTSSTLEGLSAMESARGSCKCVRVAAERGREFLLEHQLYRSSRTGAVIRPAFTRFSFPPRWYFDVLRGLEIFSKANARWDERLSDPVRLLESRRGRDGRWRAQNKHTGKTFFELEGGRSPSRMNTLRALRVLQWVNDARPGGSQLSVRGE